MDVPTPKSRHSTKIRQFDLVMQLVERYEDRDWAVRVGPVFMELLPTAKKSVKIAVAKANGQPFRKDRITDAVLELLAKAESLSYQRTKESKNGINNG
jgi:hypothetical protein